MNVTVLKESVHIVVRTPSYMLQLIKDGILNTDHIKNLALCEADELVSKGFKEHTIEIIECVSFLPLCH